MVKFQDETNDFKETQRIIRRPGYAGDIELTEALDMPGITDPALVWREAIRCWYEILHRPDVYEVTQDGAVRVATRGDTVGTSHVRIVTTVPGASDILTLTDPGPMPKVDDLAMFGFTDRESIRVLITRTEATDDMCTILRGVDAAPQIDTLTDAAAIPAWSGRVGAEIGANLIAPPAPRWTQVYSRVTASGQPVAIDYLLVPGSGPVRSARYEIDHRLQGTSSWTTIDIPAANGGGAISGYDSGQNAQLRARALSPTGTPGPYHRRSRVETKMHCVKLLGQRLMARDFDRQVAELQVRIAVMNGFTALGIPVTKAVG